MTFSIVIPTKNRPKELVRLFIAIINQTRLPDQVIIVDQSNPKNVIKKIIISKARKVNLELNYLHNEKKHAQRSNLLSKTKTRPK